MTGTDQEWDAIVLAGGRSRRLGGTDKTALRFEGKSLLDHALSAVSGARRVVVVGPEDLRGRLPRTVSLVREHPPFGGPAAATAAGLAALTRSDVGTIAVLAADLPFATEAMGELRAVGALASHADGVVATDTAGRVQPLIALYSAAALLTAVGSSRDLVGQSMRSLTNGMVLCQVRLSDRVCADIDTPAAARLHGMRLLPVQAAERMTEFSLA